MATTAPKSWDQILAEGSVIEVNGAQHEIKPLTNQDWAEFAGSIRRQQIVELSQFSGWMRASERAAATADILRHPFGDREILDHSQTPPGAAWIVKRALRKAGSKAQELNGIEHDDLMLKAAFILQVSGVINIPSGEPEKESQGEDDPMLSAPGDGSSPT